MDEIKKTGGARIGMMNATWPFATLKVNKNNLELNATILGKLVFTPQDIISIEPYGLIPVLGQGIKINHRVKSYNSKVIFWTMGNPRDLIKKIEGIRFLGNSSPMSEDLQIEINQTQNRGGFPIKTQAAILIVVVWNLLLSIDLYKLFAERVEGSPLGLGAKLAIGFIFITSILLLFTKFAREFILKEGREIDDIRKFIYFLMFICGFLFINISVMS